MKRQNVYRPVQHCVSSTLPLSHFHKRNAKKKLSTDKKKYREPLSCISHFQPMLPSTWYFKISVISPAGAPNKETWTRPGPAHMKWRKCCFVLSPLWVKLCENSIDVPVPVYLIIHMMGRFWDCIKQAVKKQMNATWFTFPDIFIFNKAHSLAVRCYSNDLMECVLK